MKHRTRRSRPRRLAYLLAAGALAPTLVLATPAGAQSNNRSPLGIDLDIDLLGQDGDVANVGLNLGGLLGIGANIGTGGTTANVGVGNGEVQVDVGIDGTTANVGVGAGDAQVNVDAALLQPDAAAQASLNASVGGVDAVAEANVLSGGTVLGACADVQLGSSAECSPNGSLLQASAVEGLLGTQTTAVVDGLLGPNGVIGACLEITLGDPGLCATQTGGPAPDPGDPGTPPVDEPPVTQPPATDPPAVGPGDDDIPRFRSPGDGAAADQGADTAGRGGRGTGALAFTGDRIAQMTALGVGLAGVGACLSLVRRRRAADGVVVDSVVEGD